jgi:hypothetical protein
MSTFGRLLENTLGILLLCVMHILSGKSSGAARGRRYRRK